MIWASFQGIPPTPEQHLLASSKKGMNRVYCPSIEAFLDEDTDGIQTILKIAAEVVSFPVWHPPLNRHFSLVGNWINTDVFVLFFSEYLVFDSLLSFFWSCFFFFSIDRLKRTRRFSLQNLLVFQIDILPTTSFLFHFSPLHSLWFSLLFFLILFFVTFLVQVLEKPYKNFKKRSNLKIIGWPFIFDDCGFSLYKIRIIITRWFTQSKIKNN